jgi:hypothetical protein
MHPNLDELLALRDGDGGADTARHVERCELCRAELEELRATMGALRELPSIAPPGEAWTGIRHRIVSQRRRSTRSRFALVAASILAVTAVTLVARFGGLGSDPESAGIGEARMAVEHLSTASRELELVLQDPSLQSRVLSPRRAAMIVEIEDRIAIVDIALAENTSAGPDERAVVLWSDRVELLDALVTARRGDTGDIGVMHAVNRNQGSLQ